MPATTPAHRFVLGSTRVTLFLLIASLGVGGILLTQRGLFALLEGNLLGSCWTTLAGAGLIGAGVALARFRNDLVDD